MSEKSEYELLKEKLFVENQNGSQKLSESEIAAADEFAEDYKRFLDAAKTEREFVTEAAALAQKNGFKEIGKDTKFAPGDKVYYINRKKALIAAVIGKQNVEQGTRITAAHIDSPRLDLKPNPLYESDDLAFLKTHYYGGIKKYQWTAIPLALHGVIIRKDGESINICIGEDAGDPQFCITDLLPHLAAEQMKKPLSTAIPGESLNILVGSRQFKDDKGSELVKLNILKILNEKYGIVESDFVSAELEMVPAAKAVDIGFDRSMVGAYGHDDRVCAYPALKAIFDMKDVPEYTCITVLADKEEVGSDGNTGLNSAFLKHFIYDIAQVQGCCPRSALANSACLSADVSAAFDPQFADVYEKKNSAFINGGVCIAKYTGSRGKSSTSDASAEFMYKIRTMLDNNQILWQMCELGKVDAGGGGTVAAYIANLNIDVVDLGVPVLSMHAPFEVISKIDLFMAYRAISAFYN